MTDDLRDLLARTIRARVRLTIGPNASRRFKEGNPVILTGGEADDAADAALAALAEHGLVVVEQKEFARLLDDHAELSKFISPEYGANVRARLRAALGTEKPNA